MHINISQHHNRILYSKNAIAPIETIGTWYKSSLGKHSIKTDKSLDATELKALVILIDRLDTNFFIWQT